MKPTIIYTINRPEDKLPETAGKFIVNGESDGYGPGKVFKTKRSFACEFTGKKFDANYNIKEWLNPEEKYTFTKDELIEFAKSFWEGSADYYADDSDFPMGYARKQEPNFDELVTKMIE